MTESHHPEMSEQYKIELTHLFLNLVRNLNQFGPLNRYNNQKIDGGKRKQLTKNLAKIQNVLTNSLQTYKTYSY